MANGTNETPGLSFSKNTFAKLTPGPFLQAHLKQADPIRPNGRSPNDFRTPAINTGSLTHSNGSAVVRMGDTAVVCGVRAEILLASDIAHPPNEDMNDQDLIEDLGLLVPNVELSTGCSPSHLPGNPPGTLAQSLSYRILSLLHNAHLFDLANFRIQHTEPATDDDLPDEGPKVVTKAYWVLYIDILCMSLDGNAFDAAWAAVIAAFQDTMLPKAWWDADREAILCSPRLAEGGRLRLGHLPIAATFAVFSAATAASPPPRRKNSSAAEAKCWVLADPDAFEEDLCEEGLTVVVSSTPDRGPTLLSLEHAGGSMIEKRAMQGCIGLAEDRWREWCAVLGRG